METANAIQETYNIWSWLLPLISGAIGALIGTYGFYIGNKRTRLRMCEQWP